MREEQEEVVVVEEEEEEVRTQCWRGSGGCARMRQHACTVRVGSREIGGDRACSVLNQRRSMPSQHLTDVIELMSGDWIRLANWQPCSGTTAQPALHRRRRASCT